MKQLKTSSSFNERDIIDFIQRRWKKDSKFLDGNCYWFAHILATRFPQLEIYYLPITGHFVAGNGEAFFDWQGRKNIWDYYHETPMKFEEIKEQDELYYNRLVRDCIL